VNYSRKEIYIINHNTIKKEYTQMARDLFC